MNLRNNAGGVPDEPALRSRWCGMTSLHIESTSAVPPATVYVIDRDAAARESIGCLLAAYKIPAQTFGRGEEFLQTYRPHWPGCVLVDLAEAQVSGLMVLARLRAMGATLPAVAVGSEPTIASSVQAMRLGAVDVLEKPYLATSLLAAVESALQLDARHRARHAQTLETRRRMSLLTDNEQAVLEQLLAGRNNKAIAARLNVGLRTVQARRAKLMRTLAVNSIAELVRLVLLAEDEPNELWPAFPSFGACGGEWKEGA